MLIWYDSSEYWNNTLIRGPFWQSLSCCFSCMIFTNVTILCSYEGYYLSWNIWYENLALYCRKMMQIHPHTYIHWSTMEKVILCLKIKVNFRLISHAGLWLLKLQVLRLFAEQLLCRQGKQWHVSLHYFGSVLFKRVSKYFTFLLIQDIVKPLESVSRSQRLQWALDQSKHLWKSPQKYWTLPSCGMSYMHTPIHMIWTEAAYLLYMCHSTCSCPPENISIHCSSKPKLKCLSRNAENMFLSGCTNSQLKLIVIPIVTSNVSFKNKWIFNSINQANNFREVWSTVSMELHHQFPWSPFTSFVKAERQTYLTLPAALTFPK